MFTETKASMLLFFDDNDTYDDSHEKSPLSVLKLPTLSKKSASYRVMHRNCLFLTSYLKLCMIL